MLQDNVKEIETYYPNDSMCVYVSECYDFITPIFQCERNKSSCKNGAWMDNVYVNHRSRVYNMMQNNMYNMGILNVSSLFQQIIANYNCKPFPQMYVLILKQ